MIPAKSYNRLRLHPQEGFGVITAYQKTLFETPTVVIDLVVPRDGKVRALQASRERSGR